MPRKTSTQADNLVDPTQPAGDVAGERLLHDLQTYYSAPEAPQRLRQSGAEQVRLQVSASARREHLGVLSRLRATLAPGWAFFARDAGTARHDGSPLRGTMTVVATVALISLLAVLLLSRPGLSQGGGGHGHKLPPAPAATVPTPPVTLLSVAVVSANDGWAFGASHSGCLVLHYNGIKWAPDHHSACVPATSISMLSADDGWAVGYQTILHYAHGTWRVNSVYAPPGQTPMLNRIAMVSADEGWAVGSLSTPNGVDTALVLHYAHGHWAPVHVVGLPTDQTSGLRGITMVSSKEGWAVGSIFGNSQENTLVLHYLNGQWTRLNWSIPGSFNGVAAFASGDVWLAGEDNPAAGPGLIVHLRHGVVVQTDRPIPGLVENIAMVSPTDGWAVGDGAATVRYHNGVWTREGLTIHQFYMTDISLVSASEGWAAGNTAVSNNGVPGSNATLFHLSDGVWGIYPLSGV